MISKSMLLLCVAALAGVSGLAFGPSSSGADAGAAEPLGFAAELPSRAAEALREALLPRSGRLPAENPALKAGLDALSSGDAPAALVMRDSLARNDLDRHILTWAIALSGRAGVSSGEILAAGRELAGWPGLKSLRTQYERALARENPPADAVIAAFAAAPPETAEGALLLCRTHLAAGETARAAQVLRALWLKEPLSKERETAILERHGDLLTPADHKARMEMLLYRDRVAQAARFGDLGKAQSLFRAWAALLRKAKNADALIAAVDASWHKDPAYAYLRIRQLRHKEDYRAAGRLLAELPEEAARRIDAAAWWNESRIVSRGLADLGDHRDAYRIVARHHAGSETDIVEAEFHAGWYALRDLAEPETAAGHFRKILDASDRPLARSRGWYWLGRAAEAGGPGEAADFFGKAAAFPGTFYGQLAAARLGRTALNVAPPQPTDEERARFRKREAVRAIARLAETGHGRRAASLYRALAGELTSPGELALLAGDAEQAGNHPLALEIGKIAFGRGIDVAALAFPIGVIPDSADIAGSGKALAYAIARQESAFNLAAVSPADARGLLQLMPGTARGVAQRYGLAYSPERLTSDAAYNATLGAHYLGEQIAGFGGSYVLTFVAYNAGPRRVKQWIARYGDPRGRPVDEVVDWIERIPFPETRAYVQRVMENYQVYKTRLGQSADIVRDLRTGR